MEPLLEVRGLQTHFRTDRGLFRAVDGIDFSVGRGKTVGLVGESGCGKSVTSLSVMGLVASPPGQVEAEAVTFDGRDVLGLSADERRKLRGGKMSMIFQEPMLDLLADLQKRLGMAILIITHDLGVIAEVADEVIVMYAGKIVESAPVAALFADPQHPYTIGLLGSIPRLDVDRARLSTI